MPVWRLCLFLFLKYSFSPLILLSQQTHSQVCDVPNRSHVPRTPPAKESFPLVKRLVSVHSLFTAVEKQAEGALSLLMAQGWPSCWKQSSRCCCIVPSSVTAPAVPDAGSGGVGIKLAGNRENFRGLQAILFSTCTESVAVLQWY